MSKIDTLLTEARGWLQDCGLRVPDADRALALKVEREYDGGWPAFVRADPDASEMAVLREAEARWGSGMIEFLYPQNGPSEADTEPISWSL